MDDELQLQRAVRGDRKALHELLAAWWPQVTVWTRRSMPDRSLADDATQEAMLRVVRFIRSYDPMRPFGAWLHQVVRNAATDVWKRQAKAPREPMREVAVHPDPNHHLDLRRAAAVALEAFDGLTARQRELVTRVDLHGESAAEVARDLGLTSGAVRNQLFTARRLLRKAVLEQGAWDGAGEVTP